MVLYWERLRWGKLGPSGVILATCRSLPQSCVKQGHRHSVVGMYPRLIIYYGQPGLETEVFRSYMASLGYRVQVVYTCAKAASVLDETPGAIVVIAADQEPEEAVHHAEALYAHLQIDGRIFVISSAQPLDLRLSGIDFVPQPYRLSELVRRIRSITPDARPN
jgi:hypothetical protein